MKTNSKWVLKFASDKKSTFFKYNCQFFCSCCSAALGNTVWLICASITLLMAAHPSSCGSWIGFGQRSAILLRKKWPGYFNLLLAARSCLLVASSSSAQDFRSPLRLLLLIFPLHIHGNDFFNISIARWMKVLLLYSLIIEKFDKKCGESTENIYRNSSYVMIRNQSSKYDFYHWSSILIDNLPFLQFQSTLPTGLRVLRSLWESIATIDKWRDRRLWNDIRSV